MKNKTWHWECKKDYWKLNKKFYVFQGALKKIIQNHRRKYKVNTFTESKRGEMD